MTNRPGWKNPPVNEHANSNDTNPRIANPPQHNETKVPIVIDVQVITYTK